jgi:Subtilase family
MCVCVCGAYIQGTLSMHACAQPAVCWFHPCRTVCTMHAQGVTRDGTGGAARSVVPLYETAVAVIDSGVMCGHPDLNVTFTKSFSPERNPDPSRDAGCWDGLGHGTHVAGVCVSAHPTCVLPLLQYSNGCRIVLGLGAS